MQLVQRHIIKPTHPYWKYFDQQSFLSKNLYNLTNYHLRQHFFQTKKVLGFTALYHLVSKTEAYYALPNTKVSKQIIRRVHKSWLGYKEAHRDWKKNPHKYLGEPKLPKYKDKTKGRYLLVFPDETVSKPLLRKGVVKLTPCPIQFNSGLTQVNEVRVVPKSGCFIVEIVYSHEEIQATTGSGIAGVDLGLVNLVTLTTNQSGVKPLLIKGGALKAINTYYNKQKAKLQSDLETKHKAKSSRRLTALTHKRNCRIDNYLHTTSRRVIDWCLEHGIHTLIIGKNDGWKQSINIGRKNNQQFVSIPHARLIEMITYKAKLIGIEVIITEESYTSKASFLHYDPIPQYCSGNPKPQFSGKRVHRGLYASNLGLLNADVNGSLNIIRKVKPNAFSYGLKGLPFSPVTLDPLRTHNFLQVV
jgi:IS605 OrfB family transposase